MRLKIAFIHYHLNTGGVTTVLKQQADAAADSCDVFILTGEPPYPLPSHDFAVIKGLSYDKKGIQAENPEKTANDVLEAIYGKWRNGCDVLHVHNPTLAKNKNFLTVLKILQNNGLALFLQIHDFAEDGRPSVYYPDEYPENCHYGVINSRDYGILKHAGLCAGGLHLIPNMVTPMKTAETKYGIDSHVLYPVRAIRRKNIGEALLMSIFFPEGTPLAITRAPDSPTDMESYKSWKTFTENRQLNVIFEAGESFPFETLTSASKFMITTSVMEGFGFSFLEPWTAGKRLLGRKLPDICCDFEGNGISLNHLYHELSIPVAWFGKRQFLNKWKSGIINAASSFKYHVKESEIENAFESITEKGVMDFGILDEPTQMHVIDHILSDKESSKNLVRINPFLSRMKITPDSDEMIRKNAAAISICYNRENYKRILMDIYLKISNNRVVQRIDKKILLKRFFDLKKFSLLKWGGYNGL